MLRSRNGEVRGGEIQVRSTIATGFPGGSVVKNPPAYAGDMGSIRRHGIDPWVRMIP